MAFYACSSALGDDGALNNGDWNRVAELTGLGTGTWCFIGIVLGYTAMNFRSLNIERYEESNQPQFSNLGFRYSFNF